MFDNADPEKFEKDVKLDFSLARDGTFKEIEVVFTVGCTIYTVSCSCNAMKTFVSVIYFH